jgi:F-type H+-transporting ATPase subunit a
VLTRAPMLEHELLSALLPYAPLASGDAEFHPPSIAEFFPPVVFFEGTPFELNRIMIIRLLVTLALVLLFYVGTRRMTLVPGRFQSLIELGLGFVRVNIAEDLLGKKDGQRFLPLITTIFFLVLGMNITGIVPALNVAGTSVIGLPMLLAVIAWFAFVYAGFRKNPVKFLRNSLFPPGVPWYFYIIVTPIEFISTFVLRPVTLTLRLTFNMIVGHLLLVLFFAATSFFLYEWQGAGLFRLFGIGTFAFGFAFTLFEILVAVLQAYVFALLTAVYIQLAVAEEH